MPNMYKVPEMKVNKKKKGPPYSETEERELWNLVRTYWSIVQCKLTDHINNQRKADTWVSIEQEFNASSSTGIHRDHKSLKTKFENMCRRSVQSRSVAAGESEDDFPAVSAQHSHGAQNATQDELSKTEKEELVALLADQQQTAGDNAELDDSIWLQVELIYNSANFEKPYRTAEFLKNEYEGILKSARKKAAQSKKSYRATGGGEYEHFDLNPIDEQIMSQLGARASGFVNTFDDDVEDNMQRFIMEEEEGSEVDEPEEMVGIDGATSTSTGAKQGGATPVALENAKVSGKEAPWKKYSPAMLRQSRSVPLQFKKSVGSSAVKVNTLDTSKLAKPSTEMKNLAEPDSGKCKDVNNISRKRKHFNDKLTLWAGEKTELAQLQKENAEDKFKQEKELLNLRIEKEKLTTQLLMDEIKLRMKCTMEKHEAEMQLINLKKKRFMYDTMNLNTK